MGEEFSIEDALIIFQRRFLYFLIPVLVIAPIGILAVMLLPAKYTAQGTILVESQQIPEQLVRSTINARAQERIQTIRQRVMTRNRLLEVADDYSLFPRSLGLTESERVREMRSNLGVDLVSTRQRRGRRTDGTVAFTVSFTNRDPNKAYLVANRFMTLFLDEDVRARTAGASNTTEFFVREAARLRDSLVDTEDKISQFKAENADALPEHLSMHLDMLTRARRTVDASESEIAQLEEEKRFLETQLLSSSGGDNALSGELARLETELARLRALYRDNYPEVQVKRDEIAAIRAQMAPNSEIQSLREALADAELELKAAERLDPADPLAVEAAENKVEVARVALSDKITEESRKGTPDLNGVQLEGRIALITNRIRMLAKDSTEATLEIADLEQRIARTPEVERALASLSRDYQNTGNEYQDILNKQQDAQLAENLEENQQAEKFSILEAALVPDSPSSPDRPKFAALAILFALGVGSICALIAELLFATIRGRHHIVNLIDGHPIAIIPYMQGEDPPRFLMPFLNKKKRSKFTVAPEAVAPEPAE